MKTINTLQTGLISCSHNVAFLLGPPLPAPSHQHPHHAAPTSTAAIFIWSTYLLTQSTFLLPLKKAGATTPPASESDGAAVQVEAAEAEAESAGTTLSEVEPSPPATDPPAANQVSGHPSLAYLNLPTSLTCRTQKGLCSVVYSTLTASVLALSLSNICLPLVGKRGTGGF